MERYVSQLGFYNIFNRVYDKTNCKPPLSLDLLRDGCHALRLGLLVQAYAKISQAVPRRSYEEVLEVSKKVHISINEIFVTLATIGDLSFMENLSHTTTLRSH